MVDDIIILSKFALTKEQKEDQIFIDNFIKANQELFDLLKEIEVEDDRRSSADFSFYD